MVDQQMNNIHKNTLKKIKKNKKKIIENKEIMY